MSAITGGAGGAMESAGISMVEAIRRALGEVLAEVEESVLIGCDIGDYGGPFKVTSGLKERFGGERVLDTPPNPAAILGFIRGLKIANKVPMCELPPELAARAAGAVVDGIGRFEARTGEAGGPMLVRIPVGRVATGMLSEGDSPEAALGFASGLRVVCPSRPEDAWSMLKAAVDPILGRDPVVVLEPKALYRRLGAPLPEAPDVEALEHARLVRPGDDLVMFCWGAAVPVAVEAAERLTADGYEARVVDLRCLVPLDLTTMTEAMRACGRALIVHEGAGSFAGAVAAEVAREAFLYLEAPIASVAGDDDWVPRVRRAALAALEF